MVLSASLSVFLLQIHSQVLHPAFFQVDSQRKGGGGFPGHHEAGGWRSPPIPNTHSETCLVFHSCCVSCEFQLAMERFSSMYALVTGAIQSLWKAVQTLLPIFMVLCHLLHLRSHPCSPLLRFQEILKSFSTILKSIKCKRNAVARLPKTYYMAGHKRRWQAQQTGLLCSSFAVLPFSPASSRKTTLGFNKLIWSVIKISDPIGSWIYYSPGDWFSDVVTDIILSTGCKGCGCLILLSTSGQGVIILNSEAHWFSVRLQLLSHLDVSEKITPPLASGKEKAPSVFCKNTAN